MNKEQIQLMVNGQLCTLDCPTRLDEFISSMDIKSRQFIVELNEEIVKKPNWDKYPLKKGDAIEIINVVGGGAQ